VPVAKADILELLAHITGLVDAASPVSGSSSRRGGI
jgi:hypothetical protein